MTLLYFLQSNMCYRCIRNCFRNTREYPAHTHKDTYSNYHARQWSWCHWSHIHLVRHCSQTCNYLPRPTDFQNVFMCLCIICDFDRIPVLYSTLGIAGRVLCGLFFICLSFAGLTTMISCLQFTTLTLKNCKGMFLIETAEGTHCLAISLNVLFIKKISSCS